MKVASRCVSVPTVGIVLASALSLVLSGCGLGTKTVVTGPTGAVRSSLTGKVHGGPNPISGATVTLWETWTSGIAATPGSGTGRPGPTNPSDYGSPAYKLNPTTVTTDNAGNWNIPNFYCDNGEYVYVTVTNGKTASNTANQNEVLLAVLGGCSTLPAQIQVNISELSTVAAAYALAPFLSDDGVLGNQSISIGAPAANNATTGGCTGAGSSMTCSATGLGQAFANAISLVRQVNYSSVFPSGQANTTPTDATGATSNTSGSIPQALINTLGNVLTSCVNTSGGTADDGSACGKLFTYTKVNNTAPTDTLQAALNIARNPTQNVGSIYLLASPFTSVFTPALTAQPTDFTLAVSFNGSDSTHTFGAPSYLVLKQNEDVVVATSSKLVDLSPTGAVSASVTPNAFSGQAILAADVSTAVSPSFTSDRLFLASTGGSSVDQYDAGTLSLVQSYPAPTPGGLAVDLNSNVYWSQSGSGSTVISLAPGSTSPQQTSFLGITGVTLGNANSIPGALAFDSGQNMWMNMLGANNEQINYEYKPVAGASPCTPPDFCGLIGYPPTPSSVVGSSYSTVFDAAGNSYSNAGGTVYALNAADTLINSYSLTSDTLTYSSIDGGGSIFLPDVTSGGLFDFSTSAGSAVRLMPCSLRTVNSTSQTTTCTNALITPANTQVDASGAVWVTDPGTGSVVKIYGVGAPAWPALAAARQGTAVR